MSVRSLVKHNVKGELDGNNLSIAQRDMDGNSMSRADLLALRLK